MYRIVPKSAKKYSKCTRKRLEVSRQMFLNSVTFCYRIVTGCQGNTAWPQANTSRASWKGCSGGSNSSFEKRAMELRKGWKGLIACKAARMQQNSHHSHQLAGDVEDVHWAPRRRCCLPRAREKCECKSVINGQEIGNRDGESHNEFIGRHCSSQRHTS